MVFWDKRTRKLIEMLAGDENVVNCVQRHLFDCAIATSGIDNTIKVACGGLHRPHLRKVVIVPPDGYLKAVRGLCSSHNIFMIADEIQTGIARPGKMLACDWENICPDVVILGKALGAGVLPVSSVLADKDIMLCITPGEHGSTFGGNPLASAVAIAALHVIKDESLAERALQMGDAFRLLLGEIQHRFPQIIKEVRGKGLLNAVELNSQALSPVTAFDVCLK